MKIDQRVVGIARITFAFMTLMLILCGCADKPSKIEKTSPCAYCNFNE